MSRIDEFCAWLEEQVGNAYVWGSQGEEVKDGMVYKKKTYKTWESWVKLKETSTTNYNRAVNFINKALAKGKRVIYAFDCSGLGVRFLYEIKGWLGGDRSAQNLYSECYQRGQLTSSTVLQKGDFVFIHNGTKMRHIGYYIGNGYTVEAYGRDRGVVKYPLKENPSEGTGEWTHWGRHKCLQEQPSSEIEALASVTIRAAADKTSKALGTLGKGKKLPRKDNGWYKVVYDGKEAYVSARDDLTKQIGTDV